MITRCIIVDDEPLAIKVIESHISKLPNLELVDSCSNAVEAFEALLNGKIDLIFLDVEMPEISGVDLVKSLKRPCFKPNEVPWVNSLPQALFRTCLGFCQP